MFYTAFFGLEDDKYINTGLGFGAEKGNNIVKVMMEAYYDDSFFNKDGSYNMVTCPVKNTESIASYLPTVLSKEITYIDNAAIYSPEYFFPLDSSGVNWTKTKNTYSIHWFSAPRLSEEETIIHNWRNFLGKSEKYGSFICSDSISVAA